MFERPRFEPVIYCTVEQRVKHSAMGPRPCTMNACIVCSHYFPRSSCCQAMLLLLSIILCTWYYKNFTPLHCVKYCLFHLYCIQLSTSTLCNSSHTQYDVMALMLAYPISRCCYRAAGEYGNIVFIS